jgi:hypothetical protein
MTRTNTEHTFYIPTLKGIQLIFLTCAINHSVSIHFTSYLNLAKQTLDKASGAKLKKCQQNHGGPNCLFNTGSHPLVFDDSINLHVTKGRPRKDPPVTDHRKKPQPITFIRVTPLSITQDSSFHSQELTMKLTMMKQLKKLKINISLLASF